MPVTPSGPRRRQGRRARAAARPGLLRAARLAAVLALLPRAAAAHVIGLSRGDYTPRGTDVVAELVLRSDDARMVVPALSGDGEPTPASLTAARPALKAAFFDTLEVRADGRRCAPTLDEAAPDPPDGVRLRATYACPSVDHAPAHLQLRFGFLDRMAADHRHLATVHLPAGDVNELAVLSRPEIDVALGAGPSLGFASMVRGGIEHILTGADHLAFLVALVLGGTLVVDEGRKLRVGSLVAMLTAFTVGHSASLAIATLGGFAPGPRLVEPAVALSVAYVGAENLFTKSVRHRWMLTLPFGFVHGFAFAGGLLPLGVPRAQLPAALLGFNLGVEAGQLAVLAVLLPGLLILRRRAWYPRAARAASGAIVAAGLLWFVQRVM